MISGVGNADNGFLALHVLHDFFSGVMSIILFAII